MLKNAQLISGITDMVSISDECKQSIIVIIISWDSAHQVKSTEKKTRKIRFKSVLPEWAYVFLLQLCHLHGTILMKLG